MKHLIAIAALLASFGTQADALNLVCGNSIITLNANAQNELENIAVDNILFTVLPDVIRKVENGQMITFFQAGDTTGGTPVTVTVVMRENGNLNATLYANKKTIWASPCRWAR